jgi:hypothetical protein
LVTAVGINTRAGRMYGLPGNANEKNGNPGELI